MLLKLLRFIVVLVVGLLAACSVPDVAEIVPGELLGTQQATAEPTPTIEPTEIVPPTATIEPTEEPVAVSNCLTCHTDQETLEVLAVEEEHLGEEISTGEG